jgi:hypothetical protein
MNYDSLLISDKNNFVIIINNILTTVKFLVVDKSSSIQIFITLLRLKNLKININVKIKITVKILNGNYDSNEITFYRFDQLRGTIV